MAARRGTGPAQAIQHGVVDHRGPALRLRAPVVLGDGEGPPTIGRWAMALCEEFVQHLYQAVLAVMALLHALCIVGGGKSLATTPSSTALHQREAADAPASEGRRKRNSQPPAASGAAKQLSRLKLGQEATTARKRNLELPSSAIPPRMAPATTTRCSPIRRLPMPSSGLGHTRSGDRTVMPSRFKLTSSRLTSPKASASAPTPTAPKNPCAAPLSSTSVTLATAPDCKKDLPESETSEVRKLRQQAGELFNAVVTVFVILANVTVTLVYCLVRMSCARFQTLMSRLEI